MILRILILSSLLYGVLSQQCGQGWKQYGDTCYLIKSDLKWWDEARKNCQNLQADLAIIPSQDVNTFLSGLIKDSNRDFWIGLHDTSNEGNFKWVDGTDLDQSQASWKPGEPNDYNLLGEDCVQIRADTGLWNDENCVTPLPYICSRKQNVEIKCDESNGWSNSNGKCYLFVDEQRSWDRAASECELVGGQLVKVENQNTQDYLNVLTSRYRRTYWIGLSDSNSDTEGDYKWSDDTSLGSYTNWAITEPNNKYFASGGNCAEVLDTVNSVGKWSTAPCSQTLSFICQRPEGICATGWRLFDGNCYQINANSPKTWTDSKHYCEAQGGYLTSILSDRENEFITSQLPELKKAGRTDVWFGMSDVASDGNFVWSEGAPITVNFWNPGQPGNVKGQTDCGSIYTDSTTATWDTKNCYVLQAFICKIKAGAAVQTIPPYKEIGSCPSNWALYGDNCYYFGTNPKSWSAAKTTCESMQASLTSILDADEQSFLSVRADIAKDNMWIGFHDANGEGNFEWTDSSTITFTNWAPGEPNNAGNEDCVHLEINYYKVGMWNDLTCSREESWVCKKPKTDDNTVHTATPLPTGAFDTRCGIDWVYDSASGKCYLLRPSDYKDWAGARDQCLIEGGDLVSITSYEEENFLISLLRGVTEPTMWIGANDLTTEGGWEWTDKEPFVYFNWKSGEPNNDGPFSGGENCGELIVNQGVWNDHKCEKNFIGYICKKDKYINKYFDSYHYAFISGKDDIVLTDVYPSDCAKRCIEGTGFTCLSFDYNRNQKTCQLSSFNKDSAGGLTPTYTGDIYDHYERDMNVPTDAPPTTLPAYYGCPSGWKPYDNYCYYADNTVANFDASSMKCQNRYAGAELASVHNVGENSFLLNLVQQDLFGHSTWIGMSDNNNEGTFAWLDGSKVDFTYWGQNQPDNWYDGEDCIELRYWDGTWNDNVCSGAFTSICKMKKIDVGNTAIPTDKGCGAGWIGHEYRCVKIVNSPKTWQDAEKDCNANNGNLMSIHDQFGQALLESELSLENGNNYWIGLSDTVTPGTYVWSDGASVSYTNWAQGQPDNSGGDCVSITSGQSSPGFWIDTNCALGLPYVCEKSRVGYTHPPHTNPPRTTPPSDQNCAPGWIGYGSSCYLPNEESSQNNRLSWLEAQQSCLKMGGDLASFHSAAEEAYILGRFTPIDQENAYWLGYWIGLNDRTIEGGYEWSDGTAVGYTNWGDGEPNDSGSEECVEMFFDGQRGWNDMDCSTVRNWICKIAKGVTPITPSPDPDAPIPCPSDSSWVYRSPYCYYVSPAYGTGRKGWQDAEDYCKSRGGHLASIHDVFEQNYVFRLVSKVIGSYWIGLREQAAGGDYKWSDGTSFDYINWAKNEPNDFNGAEQCVELEVQKLAAWNDQACGIPGPFVCKKAEDNIKPITNAPTPPPTGNCLNGWVKHSNRCYRVYGTEIADRLKWSDARSMCLAKNADLVTIHNKELQAYLSTYIKTANTDIWTGLNDRHTDGKFAWVDGTSLDFEAWAMYEPKSGVVLPDGSSSDCVKMMNSAEQTGKWDDVDCSSLNAYVCQQPLNPTLPVNPDNIEYCGQPNFRKYGDSCYMMDTTKRDFASARQLCENQNSELASIPDGYEQVFVESLVYGNNNEPVWIGMIDMKVEGEYMWLDGWPIWYTNWAENEPSKGPGEGCVRVNDDGTWEDATCTSLHYPLCKTTTAEKPVTPAPRPGTCPTSEWIPYGSHCYFFGVSFTSISWAEAEFACSLNHAGHLASIHSRAQNEFIRANVQSFLGKSVWVGLFRSDSGGFMWSDGTGVDYTFWEDGEPTMTHNGKHENCVELYPQFGYWNDENCNDGQAYVCEILKGAPVSSTDDGPNRPITPTNKDGNKEPTTGLNTGGIVGITLASCVLLLALVMIIWFVVQRKKFSFDDSKATSGIDNQLYESGTSSVQIDKKAQAEA